MISNKNYVLFSLRLCDATMINNENLSSNQMNSKSGAAIKSKSLKGKSIEET